MLLVLERDVVAADLLLGGDEQVTRLARGPEAEAGDGRRASVQHLMLSGPLPGQVTWDREWEVRSPGTGNGRSGHLGGNGRSDHLGGNGR